MSPVTSMPFFWTLLSAFLLFVSADPKIITAESGQDVTLTCRAPDDNIIAVEWSRRDLEQEYVLFYLDEQFLQEYRHQSFVNRIDLLDRQMKGGDVSLILKNVTTADSGRYECRVVQRGTYPWKRNIQADHVDTSNLSVADAPDQKNITAESGQNVTLTCRAPNNNNDIIAVEWSRADLDEYVFVHKDGWFNQDSQHPSFKNRVYLQDRQMKDGDVSLILKNVMINDTGTYECGVMREGDSVKLINSTNLVVVDPPGHTGAQTENKGKKDGSVGLKFSLPVLVLLFAVAAAFAF